MQTICDLFNILLFTTMIGSLLALPALLAGRVLGMPLPLWFGVCCAAAFILPLHVPQVWLIPQEEHGWVDFYYVLCAVWMAGMTVLTLLRLVRCALGLRALRSYDICREESILSCCHDCARLVGLRKMPVLLWGGLRDPACVYGLARPAVLLRKDVTEQLSERELMAVLCHELAHIRRRHMLLDCIFDWVCIVNWFNPFVWLMKREFTACLEADCDRFALSALRGHIGRQDYAQTLLRLYSLTQIRRTAPGMGALDFLLARRRIQLIIKSQKDWVEPVRFALCGIMLAMAVLFSLWASRAHFYPYPALWGQPEFSAESIP